MAKTVDYYLPKTIILVVSISDVTIEILLKLYLGLVFVLERFPQRLAHVLHQNFCRFEKSFYG